MDHVPKNNNNKKLSTPTSDFIGLYICSRANELTTQESGKIVRGLYEPEQFSIL